MSKLLADLKRVSWLAFSSNLPGARTELDKIKLNHDVTPVEEAHYHAVNGTVAAMLGDRTDGYATSITELQTTVALVNKYSLPNQLLGWLANLNVGLLLILANAPVKDAAPTDAQRSCLEEALNTLQATAKALHLLVPGPETFMWGRSGVASALAAETLFMLGRNDEAAAQAEVALALLEGTEWWALNARRASGCYGILWKTGTHTRGPNGTLLSEITCNLPGTINTEELETFYHLPEITLPAT